MDTACRHASPIRVGGDTSLEPHLGCSSKHNRTQPEILTISEAENFRHHFRWIATPRTVSFTGILVELRPAFTKMRVVSQHCVPIGHERIMDERTDGFEDSHAHKYLRSRLVLFCFFYFWSLLPSYCVVHGPGASKIVDVAACSRARSCIHWEGCSTLCYELCMLNCYVTRHGNISFHNGEFPESPPQSSGKFYHSPGCV
jgi:hypothetical protein